ncbi:bifunctional diaminohydroxyphosphoribosylaminopyrimidine deaminase/5-amino-6-(5-phosphoribosylamino)uracil reductase RibD [Martelella lutilitoris]|uniref:Riboflavin biosynthesis protein RibD n=1 Tax=Martelella lutilitoris TaxID=2583532 RepID=A0A5C4JMI1_9HYPH|nr:bifunctional diaminohydroxyphosphoribosylaminopyrimidine deaminase/5-amino-6-(5-phosphoribosylamino)uracil reductase RibD [Martelella lutilitoris]TNB46392.1 bifunctional diaminohydroxyphosphoribosylaminopyrimidine deaminase/5-amino-6-(5-phosphoribosylamino)uracil reductase RibD [Martelella lutilitoris]
MGIHPATDSLSAAVLAAAMTRALDGAQRFAGATTPNPPVGCVLLDKAGQVIAEGVHRKAGLAHAEAEAIASARAAGVADRIHTVIVTLEPCNHHGRTPPCADAILATPASRVIIGAPDPNPGVSGGGAARLAAAGLSVVFAADMADERAGTLARRAARLIAPFAKRVLTGLPWVTVKQALDERGGMAPPAGAKTFTSPVSLSLAHRLRRRADAILTGSGTILADDPEFTVRRVRDFAGKQRALAILDRRGRVPEAYFSAAEARGFAVIRPETPEAALAALGRRGVMEVLVEAGPSLTASMLDGGLWDENVRIEKGDPDRVSVFYRDPEFHELNEADVLPGEEE